MALELSRQPITLNQVIGDGFSQTLVEQDIIVPDIKPDILRILQVDATVTINNKDLEQDKVKIDGMVNFNIIYVGDEENQPVKSINTSTEFNHSIDIKNVDSEMIAQAEGDVEHIEFKVINGRRINVKAVVSVSSKVSQTKDLDMITDIKDKETIEVMKKNININNIAAHGDEQFVVREDLYIPSGKPSIKDLLKVDVKISEKDTKIMNNKVIVKGELNVCVLYVGDMVDDAIQSMEHEVPFTESFDISGIDENMYCDAQYNIQDVDFRLKEDDDGDIRVLGLECILNTDLKISQLVSMDIVADSYSPDMNLSLEKQICKFDEIIGVNKAQSTIKTVVDLPSDVPDIKEVYNVVTKPIISEARVEKNKIIVDGVIDTYILYLADSEKNPVYSFKKEIPFNEMVDVKDADESMTCDIKLDTQHCSYNMSSNSGIEIRCILGIDCKVIKTSQIDIINNAKLNPIDINSIKQRPSITIYFVQEGDTLWEVAKEYQTTISDIIKVNDIEKNSKLSYGQKLLIPRRAKK